MTKLSILSIMLLKLIENSAAIDREILKYYKYQRIELWSILLL